MISILKYFVFSLKNIIHDYGFIQKLKKQFPDVLWPANIKIVGPIHHLKIGSDSQIGDYVVIHLGGFDWSQGKGSLTIGKNACISSHCVIFAAGPYGVKIGNHFDCGPGVKIFSSKSYYKENETHHDFEKVIIGNRVVLYANVVISPGVEICDDVIIAANAVVTQSISEPGLYGGAPAKRLK